MINSIKRKQTGSEEKDID